eukprot:CAMPEP_0113943466 /NCGR_PEP_ID=MMETSP1339-20121228/24642_1 /TAXON_ID=94617 /ORGANISM="Fibrocapsa japonica" /LENGTH=297 /DNA_ID=CAMNT_0000948347 /DNA_START=19 /DNA_END=912 /DNA_ORIENTATION=+ /assembly_acc=CAM_ASM_000762
MAATNKNLVLPVLSGALLIQAALSFSFVPSQTTTQLRLSSRSSSVQSSQFSISTKPSPSFGIRQEYADRRYHVLYSSAEGEDMFDNVQGMVDFQAFELLQNLKGTTMYLVGMMGSGKTSVGKCLTGKLQGYSFLDTDDLIETLTGKTVNDIFADDGEEALRAMEVQVMDQVQAFVRCVVSTGGGIVLQSKNWGCMQTGLVIYLRMQVADIVERLKKDESEVQKRPLLQGGDPEEKLQAILDKRKDLYEQADVVVDVQASDSIEEVASKVIEGILDFIEENPPKWVEWKKEAQERGTI